MQQCHSTKESSVLPTLTDKIAYVGYCALCYLAGWMYTHNYPGVWLT